MIEWTDVKTGVFPDCNIEPSWSNAGDFRLSGDVLVYGVDDGKPFFDVACRYTGNRGPEFTAPDGWSLNSMRNEEPEGWHSSIGEARIGAECGVTHWAVLTPPVAREAGDAL